MIWGGQDWYMLPVFFFFPDLINRHDLHHTPYGTGTYAYINSFSASQLVAK